MARPARIFFTLKILFGPTGPVFRAGWAVKIMAPQKIGPILARPGFGPTHYWPSPARLDPPDCHLYLKGNALDSHLRCSYYLSSFLVLLGLSSRDPFPMRCWLENLFYRLFLMGHRIYPYPGLDEIGSPSSIIIFIIISYLFNYIFL